MEAVSILFSLWLETDTKLGLKQVYRKERGLYNIGGSNKRGKKDSEAKSN